MSDVELLTLEYVEEVVNAGGAKLMTSQDLATFISELVLNNFDPIARGGLRAHALEMAQMMLLPEECKRRGISVDTETVARLRESLS